MHSSKGLEFDCVFISHVNQNVIPHFKVLSIKNPREREKQMEEERRVLYVGMSRARKYLNIFYSKTRINKSRAVQISYASQFLFETLQSVKVHSRG
jgi:DNA helicase-2/ATP-dependent DNA helicase PcrA